MSEDAVYISLNHALAPKMHQGPPHKSSGRPRGFGLRPTSCHEESEARPNLLFAKHVDDIYVAGTEDTIDKCVKCVEDMLGNCAFNAHIFQRCCEIC
eukprot:4691538-Pyramimonas_sp.AAC.2